MQSCVKRPCGICGVMVPSQLHLMLSHMEKFHQSSIRELTEAEKKQGNKFWKFFNKTVEEKPKKYKLGELSLTSTTEITKKDVFNAVGKLLKDVTNPTVAKHAPKSSCKKESSTRQEVFKEPVPVLKYHFNCACGKSFSGLNPTTIQHFTKCPSSRTDAESAKNKGKIENDSTKIQTKSQDDLAKNILETELEMLQAESSWNLKNKMGKSHNQSSDGGKDNTADSATSKSAESSLQDDTSELKTPSSELKSASKARKDENVDENDLQLSTGTLNADTVDYSNMSSISSSKGDTSFQNLLMQEPDTTGTVWKSQQQKGKDTQLSDGQIAGDLITDSAAPSSDISVPLPTLLPPPKSNRVRSSYSATKIVKRISTTQTVSKQQCDQSDTGKRKKISARKYAPKKSRNSSKEVRQRSKSHEASQFSPQKDTKTKNVAKKKRKLSFDDRQAISRPRNTLNRPNFKFSAKSDWGISGLHRNVGNFSKKTEKEVNQSPSQMPNRHERETRCDDNLLRQVENDKDDSPLETTVHCNDDSMRNQPNGYQMCSKNTSQAQNGRSNQHSVPRKDSNHHKCYNSHSQTRSSQETTHGVPTNFQNSPENNEIKPKISNDPVQMIDSDVIIIDSDSDSDNEETFGYGKTRWMAAIGQNMQTLDYNDVTTETATLPSNTTANRARQNLNKNSSDEVDLGMLSVKSLSSDVSLPDTCHSNGSSASSRSEVDVTRNVVRNENSKRGKGRRMDHSNESNTSSRCGRVGPESGTDDTVAVEADSESTPNRAKKKKCPTDHLNDSNKSLWYGRISARSDVNDAASVGYSDYEDTESTSKRARKKKRRMGHSNESDVDSDCYSPDEVEWTPKKSKNANHETKNRRKQQFAVNNEPKSKKRRRKSSNRKARLLQDTTKEESNDSETDSFSRISGIGERNINFSLNEVRPSASFLPSSNSHVEQDGEASFYSAAERVKLCKRLSTTSEDTRENNMTQQIRQKMTLAESSPDSDNNQRTDSLQEARTISENVRSEWDGLEYNSTRDGVIESGSESDWDKSLSEASSSKSDCAHDDISESPVINQRSDSSGSSCTTPSPDLIAAMESMLMTSQIPERTAVTSEEVSPKPTERPKPRRTARKSIPMSRISIKLTPCQNCKKLFPKIHLSNHYKECQGNQRERDRES